MAVRRHRLDDSRNYVRDTHGKWRYRISGRVVPGSRDAGVAGARQFVVDRGHVLVPAYLAANESDLRSAQSYKITTDQHAVVCHLVPLAGWQANGDRPLTLWAPEISIDKLLGAEQAAAYASVSADTLRELWANGRAPAPAYQIDGIYHWAAPPLDDWFHWIIKPPVDATDE